MKMDAGFCRRSVIVFSPISVLVSFTVMFCRLSLAPRARAVLLVGV